MLVVWRSLKMFRYLSTLNHLKRGEIERVWEREEKGEGQRIFPASMVRRQWPLLFLVNVRWGESKALGIEEYNTLRSALRKGDEQWRYCIRSELWYLCWKLCNICNIWIKYINIILSLQSFCWAFADISVSWSYTLTVGLLGRGISPSQVLYLHTGQH
jgi:hypothetical protein